MPSSMRILKKLAYYLWPNHRKDLKLRVILSLSCLGLAKIASVYTPFFYKWAVDALTTSENEILVLPLGMILAYGAARVLSQAFGQLRDFLFVKVSHHAQRVIALQTFKHLHALHLKFHLDRQTGALSRIIERGTKAISFVLSFMLFNILPTLIEIILVTIILYSTFDWVFPAITLGTIVIYIAYTLWVTEWRLQLRRRMNTKDNEANTKAIDSLLNFETVKYFSNETHEAARYDRSLAEYEDAAIKSQSSISVLNIGQSFIIGVGLIALMVLAGQGVVEKRLTLGDFVLVNTYLIQLYLPLNFLGFVYREIKQSLVDMDQMFQLLDVEKSVSDLPNAKPLEVTRGKIEFRGVNFSYHSKRKILKNINFTVEPGQSVAIVGSSGSGKSTIARILFRFFDLDSGQILIDDQDISQVTQASLRRAIGIVPQDTVLFNDSIFYNIQYGNPLASKEEIIQAAKLAQIHEFVESLADGYQTRVGERGLKLSGGEKQRVAIARTLLKNPPILLFDEATSALDSKTENSIQAAIETISRQKTTLIIAHRLSTITHCDQILVMKQGQIVEKGKHSDLINQKGDYCRMWHRQLHVKSH